MFGRFLFLVGYLCVFLPYVSKVSNKALGSNLFFTLKANLHNSYLVISFIFIIFNILNCGSV